MLSFVRIFHKEMTIGRLIEDLQQLEGEGKCKLTDVIEVTISVEEKKAIYDRIWEGDYNDSVLRKDTAC